ncbi:hypothetical protein RF11_03318 [Thelohanellus kitauei]|uniref:Uncharacterized protein n=1 Tax=Thelohanellus kitauei TaxID=669202 RepID=A0A0C2N561_THEKT|nr:hypothetical protein RF11_03318 [Thelohanellus kitauei]
MNPKDESKVLKITLIHRTLHIKRFLAVSDTHLSNSMVIDNVYRVPISVGSLELHPKIGIFKNRDYIFEQRGIVIDRYVPFSIKYPASFYMINRDSKKSSIGSFKCLHQCFSTFLLPRNPL